MDFEVKVGNYRINGIESITIESSVDLLSDKCTITFPGALYNKPWQVEDKLKRGDKVTVKLGYNVKDNPANLHTEFVGYLRSFGPNLPMKLECEDAAYLLRKPIPDRHFKKTTAVEVIRYIVGEVNKQLTGDSIQFVTNLKGLDYEKFTLIRANGYEALQKIKDDFGIAIYCRTNAAGKPELHCHLAYTEKRGEVKYDFMKNVEESDDLKYIKKDDVRFRAKVIGHQKNGKTIQIEVGDKGGDLRTIHLPNVSSKESLEKAGKEHLKRLTYDGYKGSLKGWLIPVCEIGYYATVVDKEYPEREGKYFVNAVKTEFNKSGGCRTVTLGVKLS
ncbi:hypothetical protein [Fibrisoma montanum]|nr:hypothetical protein [Fibrisoma montanum]